MEASKMIADRSILSRLYLFRNVALESIQVHLEKALVQEIAAGEVLLDPEKENRHI